MVNYPEFLSGANKATTNARNLFHLSGCRSANCGWNIVRCKSAQSICIKHYRDCRLFCFWNIFLCKKRRQNSLFLPMFLDLENRHFSFCCRRSYKIPPKWGFAVGVRNIEISGTDQWRQYLSHWSPAFWFENVVYFENYGSFSNHFYWCRRQRV